MIAVKLLFSARDFEELKSKLSSISVCVPCHPKDRENEHVETYSLISLLGSIPWDISCFPIKVFRRDGPDFLIVCNSLHIGLEHTEGINQNLAKERSLRADGHGPDNHFLTAASVHDPVKSSKDIIAEIEADKMGVGWCGDSVERGWAEAICHFIQRKVANAGKSGYQLYEDNRLMIYDMWPAPGLKHQKAVPLLLSQIDPKTWEVFGRIYIIDEHATIEVSATTGVFHNGRHDLAI